MGSWCWQRPPSPAPRPARATADNLRAAIAWAEAENTRAGSPLNGKIALDRVAVMGQSCGGFMALELGADPRVDTIGVFNSGAQGENVPALVAKLHGPVLLINGHERDFLMASSEATFDAIQKPAGLLRRAAQRRPYGDGRSPRRRRVRERRLELDRGGSSRATRKPEGCSRARTAACVRTRTG